MPATRQGQTTSPAARALILEQVDALVKEGKPLRAACLELGLNHNNYYRWKAEALVSAVPQAPKVKAKKGRKALFPLTEGETKRLRFWRLVKGSIPLAVETFIAEALRQDADPYFSALRECVGARNFDAGDIAQETTARALRAHWQSFIDRRKVVAWPVSIQRACRVTTQEEAAFRGRKHASDARGMERRGNLIRTEDGKLIPWYAGAIWESDDMSLNDPFRFRDSVEGVEILGRQALFTIDAYSLHWLGCTHIGRDRDSYRAEDIASHFGDIVDQHGLPLIWRIEKGRWDNNFIWGVTIGQDAEGNPIRWGGLDAIINIRDKFTSQGKANVEGSFNLLQSLMDHGFNGQTLSIGRSRGEFEYATRQMLRAGREKPDLEALAQFWSIEQSADAVQRAMHLFNSRPKQRHNWNNEIRVPAELWAECIKRPCPSDSRWRFLPVKMTATVNRGIITAKVPHYPQSFRFQVHNAPRCPGVTLDHGYDVLIAFHPGELWQGCHVFNGDKTARNRDGYGFGERIGVAEWMEDALQEDLAGGSYSPGANRAAAQVRREFRSIIAHTPFAGRRVSHGQDNLGNRLAMQSAGPAEATQPLDDLRSPEVVTAPARGELVITNTRRRGGDLVSTAADDFNEDEELRALASL